MPPMFFEIGLEVKRTVMECFGGKCECCGEERLERLTLGHSNGDGGGHRRVSGRGTSFYRKLIKTSFESSFEIRVQCFNCNFGSYRNSGICPHKTLTVTHSSIRDASQDDIVQNQLEPRQL